eukprot:331840_1
MPTVHSKMMIAAFAIAMIVFLHGLNAMDEDFDDDIFAQCVEDDSEHLMNVGSFPPKDVYNDLKGSVWFKPHTGVSETLFDYIHNELCEPVTEARNIYFEFGMVHLRTHGP